MSKKPPVSLGFELQTEVINLDHISPSKILPEATLKSRKFKQIVASIEEVGIIEPLVIKPKYASLKKHILLDGHLRFHALRHLGVEETLCLMAKDDETFTYNKFVSRQAPIQEHKMIQKAIANGVSEEKIAKALNLNVKSIIQKRSLLKGICPEAVNLLKDKMVATGTFHVLKKMKPLRQIETSTLMIDANDFTVSFAKSLLAVTHESHLVDSERKPKTSKKLSKQKQICIEEDITNLEREYKEKSKDIGPKILLLTYIKSYIEKLLKNPKVVRFLSQNHPDMLQEFEKIAAIKSL